MKLADQLRARAKEVAAAKEAQDAEQFRRLQVLWDKAVADATGPEIRDLMLKQIEGSGPAGFAFRVLRTLDVPNIRGGQAQDLLPPLSSSNLYRAVVDQLISEATILLWYPPFREVKDFYEKEGFEVVFEPNYDDGGFEWIELIVRLP